MKTIEDALKYADTFDSPHTQHMSIVMLSAEVRRLRDEVNGLTGSLERAESVLQNLMSFLSVNGCRTEIDPENAELRIRDGINMLVQPVLERAELAEKALKEAQEHEQEPVAFWWIGPDGKDNGGPYRGKPSDAAIDNALNMGCEPVLLYARPVPAVTAVTAVAVVQFSDNELDEIHQLAYELGGTENGEYILDGEQLDQVIVKAASLFYKPAVTVPAVPEGWREVVNAMVEWWDDQHMTMAQGREIRNKARALLRVTGDRK